MSRKQKKTLWRILAAGLLLLLAALVAPKGLPMWRLLAFAVPYAVIGYDVLLKAGRGIRHGQMLDEHFLMSLATIGAFCIGEYAEAVFVMLFYQVGELFQSLAVGKSRRSIAALMDIRPDVAHLARPDTADPTKTVWTDVDPEEIRPGDIIQVRAGERVPLDGTLVEGASYLDTAALTGESAPRYVAPGDTVISGCVNGEGTILVRVEREYGESTVARILALVESSAERKSHSEAFITRFARIYTPAVVVSALLLALVPSLFTGAWALWIERALTFLVVSCPCALVISVPLSFFGGIGGASRRGILFKGGNYLEALGQCDTVVMDKTGTLTIGRFCVSEIISVNGASPEELLEIAAQAEQYSSHPIALSLMRAWEGEIDASRVRDVKNVPGEGVIAWVDGVRVAVGNTRLMAREHIVTQEAPIDPAATAVYVAREGSLMGYLTVRDELKPEAKQALTELRQAGVKHIVMLTGDREAVAAAVAKELNIDEYAAECLPDGKVERLEALIEDCHARNSKSKLAFVGDGINDAPVLSRADVGIAMGRLGADAAIEAADVVLMDDKLTGIAKAMHISRRTGRIVRQNIVFALGVKGLVLLLGALGYGTLWAAVFADVGVAVLAILNAMRTLK